MMGLIGIGKLDKYISPFGPTDEIPDEVPDFMPEEEEEFPN